LEAAQTLETALYRDRAAVRIKTHAGALALAGILGFALALRLFLLLTHTYIVHPDETFQYLEQAHRLAFGYGVVPWEFHDGIRSWLFPGVLAGLMRLVAGFDSSPQAYLFVIRSCCVVASLSVPYVGFRLAQRRLGLPAAIVTGLLCALWYQLLYFAPVVMTEIVATHVALWAIYLADDSADAPAPSRRLAAAGALFALATCLRFQYAPALVPAVIWQCGLDRRRWMPVIAGGLAVVLLASGVLDAVTWGTPFQSVWLNFVRNATQGVSAGMGTEPWSYYLQYLLVATGPWAPVLAALLLLGAYRVPALGLAAVSVVLLHSFAAHKEIRFIYFALAAAPILIGIGTAVLLDAISPSRRALRTIAVLLLPLLLCGAEASVSLRQATPADAWHRDAGTVAAFFAAHADAAVCGVGVRIPWVYRTGGYTYLHRPVPLYFEGIEQAEHPPGVPRALPLSVMLHGKVVPQYPNAQLAAHTGRFNAMIAFRGDEYLGYAPTACFRGPLAGERTICLYRRPGGCD
jgi:GPI mannosyltransferase 3